MWMTRPALAALLVAAMGLPAMAQPIEIATLGRAPLMGQSTSPAELQYNIKKNEALMRQAGMDLGLTTKQYNDFRFQLDVQKPSFVNIPRHLDAMTWASGGQVHVLHDVIIPPNQKGVEIDLHDGDKTIALFLPAKCGNLSVIRRTEKHVATIRNFPVPHVASAYAPPPPAQEVAVVPPLPPPDVAAQIPLPAPPVVAHHGFSLLPLAALLPFLIHGGGGGGTTTPGGGTIVGPPPCP